MPLIVNQRPDTWWVVEFFIPDHNNLICFLISFFM